MSLIYQAIESSVENWLAVQDLAAHTLDEQMLPLDQEKMLANTLAGVMLASGKVVGYAAQTASYTETDTAEIGSLIVHPNYRGRGLGSDLIRVTTSRVVLTAVKNILAFCNPNSAPLFEKLGYQHMSLDDVPSDSLLNCQNCPKKCNFPLNSCCDKAYIFEDAWSRNKVE